MRQGGGSKAVPIIYPYYQNAEFFHLRVSGGHTYSASVRQYLSAIIVDDGSPTRPAVLPAHLPFPMRLFRLDVDIRWNWLGASNRGFHEAPDGWCMKTDMDHVIPETTATALVYGRHNPSVIYGLSRIEHDGTPLAAHPNSWFITREMFWKVGGYDEALSGHYGTDGEWRRRCASTAPIHILSDRLIRHENQGDSSTVDYLRKQPEDAAVKQIIAARGKNWRPKTLSFAYHEVVASEAVCQ